MYPERFANLPDYAFPRLRALLDGHAPGGDVLHMSIGEPRHPFPPFVTDAVARHAHLFNSYPPNDGAPELLQAIGDWIKRRYGVTVAPDRQVMALNGTREGLFNAALALCPEQKGAVQASVLMPNPFYQVYMVAALSAGAQPVFVPATSESGHLPDFASLPGDALRRCAVAYVCSPANPQGAVASREYWRTLIGLAETHDFRIFADECYSEIYRDEPPVGALEVAAEMGADPERVLVFHSLSKRSNLPGLRSGFVAGGPESIARVRQLRSYAGAPLPGPLQMAAAEVWADEAHVEENRRLYRRKYALADEILGDVPGYRAPEAGFFLWLPVTDGEAAALALWKRTGVRVLPGAYLSHEAHGVSPGRGYIRVAMVGPEDEVRDGLTRLRGCVYGQ